MKPGDEVEKIKGYKWPGVLSRLYSVGGFSSQG